jgi:hypothetical protein
VDSLTALPYLSTENSLRYIKESKFGGSFRTFGGREKSLPLPETEPRRLSGSDRRTVTMQCAVSPMQDTGNTFNKKGVLRSQKLNKKSLQHY